MNTPFPVSASTEGFPAIVRMANVLRSEFLGSALQSRTATSSKPAQRVQTQALFKKAEKTAKRQGSGIAQKAKQATSKVQKSAKKSAPSPIKKAQKAVSRASSGKKTKGWLGGAGGAQGLDKWYGKCILISSKPFVCNDPRRMS